MHTNPIPINPLSIGSLHLGLYENVKQVSKATGFIVQHTGMTFLVTNYHVASGIRPDTYQQSHEADRVVVPMLFALTTEWLPVVFKLRDNGLPTWAEHPCYQSKFDAVAIPVDLGTRLTFGSYDYHPGAPVAILPGSPVTIVGFPEGVTGPGVSAIWKQGAIASEINWPHTERKVENEFFFIDSNTRSGMSGSPVVVRQFGSSPMLDGSTVLTPGFIDRIVGVYAGRESNDPDMTIGRVWKWEGIQEILDSAVKKIESGDLEIQTPDRLFYKPSLEKVVKRLNLNLLIEIPNYNFTGLPNSKVRIPLSAAIQQNLDSDTQLRSNFRGVQRHERLRAALAAAEETSILELNETLLTDFKEQFDGTPEVRSLLD